MTISAVVVTDIHSAIGKDNKLLIHFPADLKRFKAITTGHSIIMGRKTFESLGKPLPNRRNIVISRQTQLNYPGVEMCQSIEQALDGCRSEAEVFIIGGAEIYNLSFHLIDLIYLTRIHKAFEADTYFPEINPVEWKLTEQEHFESDEKNDFSYSFLKYESRPV